MSLSRHEEPYSYRIREKAKVPALSLCLATLPMLPFLAGAAGVWLVGPPVRDELLRVTMVWGGSILAFLAGVRRGLSFRAPQGETMPQLATMLYLFVLAFAALAAAPSRLSLGLLSLGFASIALFDTLAARREEAPPYFAKLRPPQMAVAFLSLIALMPWA